MSSNKKEKKNAYVVKEEKSNQCPVKEGNDCKVPGVFSDSEPIGGGG